MFAYVFTARPTKESPFCACYSDSGKGIPRKMFQQVVGVTRIYTLDKMWSWLVSHQFIEKRVCNRKEERFLEDRIRKISIQNIEIGQTYDRPPARPTPVSRT